MSRYTKRTQVLLSEEQYERLMREARARGYSLGSLIRDAVEQAYPEDRGPRLKAAREIAGMELPVAGWKQMEEEIIRGATGEKRKRGKK